MESVLGDTGFNNSQNHNDTIIWNRMVRKLEVANCDIKMQ